MFDFEYAKDIIKKNWIFVISIVFSVICLITSGVLFYYYNDAKTEKHLNEIAIEEESIIDVIETSVIKVDVKGAVKKAGVYELDSNSTIHDAIIMAGGVTSKGSTKNINLAKKLTDEMVIYVFTKEELENKEKTNEVVCEIPKCECETIVVNECPNIDETLTPEVDDKPKEESVKISINTASLEELMTLSGVGESKAKAIIEYRETNGQFKTIEEIMNVSGIGESAFEKIKDKITIKNKN